MIEQFPLWVLIIDYFLGLIMWLMIIRFFISLFFSQNPEFKLIKPIYRITDFIIEMFQKIIPSFLPVPLISIYLSWIFFMIRFYILPIVNGIDAIGYMSFPFERLIYNFTVNIFI